MANNNTLYYGDNLYIMQEKIERASVDLIYLDPPFNSARNYNIIYKDTTGNPVPEQTLAFSDTWELTAEQEANIRNLPDLMERNGIDEFYIQLWNFWLNALRNTNSPLLSFLYDRTPDCHEAATKTYWLYLSSL
jgi:DNA modification methylase